MNNKLHTENTIDISDALFGDDDIAIPKNKIRIYSTK